MNEVKQKPTFKVKILLLLSVIGPGLITANIDNDAGGIATYSLAGAQTGYRLLWVLLPIVTASSLFKKCLPEWPSSLKKGLLILFEKNMA